MVKKKKSTTHSLLQDIAGLSKQDVEFLHAQLGKILENWNDYLAEVESPNQTETTAPNRKNSRSSSGNSNYIEWKYIRRKGKEYGPYPYWRYRENGTYKSIYMKNFKPADSL
ncbi:hypothetical protein BV378_15315 [Nostoc sp. RF31YmG]|nr:hypothetical protein BV378_15315 [Nostoc sp. RF31YmG]